MFSPDQSGQRLHAAANQIGHQQPGIIPLSQLAKSRKLARSRRLRSLHACALWAEPAGQPLVPLTTSTTNHNQKPPALLPTRLPLPQTSLPHRQLRKAGIPFPNSGNRPHAQYGGVLHRSCVHQGSSAPVSQFRQPPARPIWRSVAPFVRPPGLERSRFPTRATTRAPIWRSVAPFVRPPRLERSRFPIQATQYGGALHRSCVHQGSSVPVSQLGQPPARSIWKIVFRDVV